MRVAPAARGDRRDTRDRASGAPDHPEMCRRLRVFYVLAPVRALWTLLCLYWSSLRGPCVPTSTRDKAVGDLMTHDQPETEKLLTPAEVAALFRVDPKTVTRWAKAGKLTSIRTLGGHRRYRENEVRSLLSGE